MIIAMMSAKSVLNNTNAACSHSTIDKNNTTIVAIHLTFKGVNSISAAVRLYAQHISGNWKSNLLLHQFRGSGSMVLFIPKN